MKRNGILIAVMGMVTMLALAGSLRAEDLTIQSFDSSGKVVFNEIENAMRYRVEWASSTGGPWTNFAAASAGLDAIHASGMGVVTAAVPMCYRVVAEMIITGMASIPGGVNSGTDPEFGAYSLMASAFLMDRTEVTKAQWDKVYAWAVTHGYSFQYAGSGQTPNHPVHTVNWYDCVKWCNARSEKENKPVCYKVAGSVYKSGTNDAVTCDLKVAGYRLPTAEEWEYAARGGVKSTRFPWGDTMDHGNANYWSDWPDGSPYSPYDTGYEGYDTRFSTNGGAYTSPPGSFAANGYGLFDVVGNVSEWCWGWYPGEVGAFRERRGGDWSSSAEYGQLANRGLNSPATGDEFTGFRAVLPPGL